MKVQINQVWKFHEKFEMYTQRDHKIDPPEYIHKLRANLIMEEALEVKEELESQSVDKKKLAKEIADLLYVTFGTIISYGLQNHIEDVFDEVHRSNMSKLEDGKVLRREDGKILKGKDYTPADISSIFE